MSPVIDGNVQRGAAAAAEREPGVAHQPAQGTRLIFVVGSSRSGTTMMGRILGRHPAVFTLKELHFFEQAWSGHVDDRPGPAASEQLAARLFSVQRQGYLNRKTPELFREEAEALVEGEDLPAHEVFARFLRYEARLNGCDIPCDQTPRNLFYVDEILAWYPGAVVVNMIRDPRDVLLSQKNKWRRRRLGGATIPAWEAFRARINYHPITVTRLWVSAVRTARRHAGNPRFADVRFERLLTMPESEVARVCKLAQLEFSPDMLNVPRKGSSVRTDDSSATGMDPDRANAWRRGGLSRTEVYLCELIAGREMRDLDIKASNLSPNWFALSGLVVLFPVHLILALLANLRRFGSIGAAIRRRLG